jgi:glucose/arabinose dehydrogenase
MAVLATPVSVAAEEIAFPSLWVVDDVAKATYNVTLEGVLNTSFGKPNTAISSIAVDPVDGTLWGVNEGGASSAGKLVNYSRSGVVLGEISSETFGALNGEGLAVASDGNSLWVVDDPRSGSVEVPTVYNVARDGTLLSSFETSVFSRAARSPQAIAYDPYTDSLWITDNSADAVFNVSLSGGLIRSFPTDAGPFVTSTHPGGATNIQGITVESAGNLWVTDRTNGWLYRVTKTGTRISQSFPATEFGPAASNPTGIAFDTATPTAET